MMRHMYIWRELLSRFCRKFVYVGGDGSWNVYEKTLASTIFLGFVAIIAIVMTGVIAFAPGEKYQTMKTFLSGVGLAIIIPTTSISMAGSIVMLICQVHNSWLGFLNVYGEVSKKYPNRKKKGGE